jgi:5-methyltetrahydrofolate--homocysteine methyltransferase
MLMLITPAMSTLEQLSQAVGSGKSKDAKALCKRALDEGTKPGDILDQALVPAMATVGEKFKNNLIFVPEMLVAARAMKEAMTLLEPCLVAAGITPKYTAIIGTVQGDLHDIGKNLVAIMWKGANFRVVDLGTNVPPAKFVAAVHEHQPQLVGLSALLTTTMPAITETVRAIRNNAGQSVQILVGGAPVTQQFADEIGADGYAPDAGSAVDKAQILVGAA